MQTYISLLRGINVAGQKKIKMAELRLMYEKLGFESVRTYIQSGNVIFKTRKMALDRLEARIKSAIAETFGFDVPILVLQHETLQNMVDENPYKDRTVDPKFIYFTLLKNVPESERVQVVEAMNFPDEEFAISNRVVYLCVPNGYGRTKLSNNFFENKLKVQATTRNLKSIRKLLELSSS